MSEGIYIGLSGNVKSLHSELVGIPIGLSFKAFGRFLDKVNYADEEDEKIVDGLAEELQRQFDSQGHSGGSAMVTMQQLCALAGANCLDKKTYDYCQNIPETSRGMTYKLLKGGKK